MKQRKPAKLEFTEPDEYAIAYEAFHDGGPPSYLVRASLYVEAQNLGLRDARKLLKWLPQAIAWLEEQEHVP